MSARPYKVRPLGGGKRRSFATIDAAVRFAHKQSVASWAREDWTVWEDGKEDAVAVVTADGVVYDPFAPVTDLGPVSL